MNLQRVEASGGPKAGCLRGERTNMKRANTLLLGLLPVAVAVLLTGCGGGTENGGSERDSQTRAAEGTEALSVGALTKKQASTVLKLVDDICGDTWCEGDHNFHFDRIQCTRGCQSSPGKCRLAFRLFPYGSDLATGPTYPRSCETTGFTGFASLVDTAPNGYQSLNWQYYDALTACISELESKLPAI